MGDAGRRCSCWRSGAIFAGYLGRPFLCRRRPGRVLEERDPGAAAARFARRRRNTVPLLDRLSAADRCGLLGIAIAYLCYMFRPGDPGRRSAMQFRALYLFLLNKWYFDELYDRLFVRTAFALGDGLWKTGDGAIIDGLGPGRHRRGDPRAGARGQPAADRLCLPLRLRHADRRRRAGHLVPVPAVSDGRSAMSHWPLLSLVTFLPLVGAAFILMARGDEAVVARNARNIALWTSLIVFRAVARAVGRFRSRRPPRSSSSRRRAGSGSAGSRSTITWGSTASRCSSCCCRPC